MQNNKDRFEKIQIRLVGMAVSTIIVYFYLLEKLKDGLGVIYPWVQQIVACFMIILVITSGWKFVELMFKGRNSIGNGIKNMIDKTTSPQEDEEEDKK